MINNLESGHFYFREMAESDWQAVHEYASQEIVSRYQPWGPNTEQDSKEFVDAVLLDASKEPRTRFVFAIVLKNNDKLIGSGEINIRDIENKTGEIGYIVNPAYWGQGVATETARKLIDFGFNNLSLHRIYATCAPKNSASRKVLGKIEMVKEGLMRETLLMKDGWRDSLLYSVLEQEWRNGKRKGFEDGKNGTRPV